MATTIPMEARYRDLFAHFGRHVVSVEEAGQVLGLGRTASYNAVKRGDIPTIKIGRRLVVPVAQLEALLNGEAVHDDR